MTACGARTTWSPTHDIAHAPPGWEPPPGIEIIESICIKPAGHPCVPFDGHDDGTINWPDVPFEVGRFEL